MTKSIKIHNSSQAARIKVSSEVEDPDKIFQDSAKKVCADIENSPTPDEPDLNIETIFEDGVCKCIWTIPTPDITVKQYENFINKVYEDRKDLTGSVECTIKVEGE